MCAFLTNNRLRLYSCRQPFFMCRLPNFLTDNGIMQAILQHKILIVDCSIFAFLPLYFFTNSSSVCDLSAIDRVV